MFGSRQSLSPTVYQPTDTHAREIRRNNDVILTNKSRTSQIVSNQIREVLAINVKENDTLFFYQRVLLGVLGVSGLIAKSNALNPNKRKFDLNL